MHSDVFSVIADPTRRRIVRILAEQTHTVGAVVEKLSMSQPTISKHLKVLRDADVVSVTVEGQRRLYSLNPEVFATVTDWINETVQIARRASEAPVALPGGATLSSEHAPTEKAEAVATEPAAEKVAEPKAVEAHEVKPAAQSAEQPAAEAQPTAEELEQERIRRARAQYITPNTRIIARPAHPAPAEASPAAASETTRDSESQAIPEHEEAVDSTPMRPFTPASYGYDAGRTARPEVQVALTATAEPVEEPAKSEKPVEKTESPAVSVSSGYGFDSASSYGIDPAAVVGGSVQPIVEESAAEEGTAEEGTAEASAAVEDSSERSEEATVAAPAIEPAEDSAAAPAEDSATAEEASEQAEGSEEASEETPEEPESAPAEPAQSEPEYQTMPAYNSAYVPAQESKEKEHRGGLFGFLRGRRR